VFLLLLGLCKEREGAGRGGGGRFGWVQSWMGSVIIGSMHCTSDDATAAVGVYEAVRMHDLVGRNFVI
jgi:hypothetical protein